MACWVVAAGLFALSRTTQQDTAELLVMAAIAIATLPIGLAINTWARRRRTHRREDSRDSVEHEAAHRARSQSFGDSLILGALLILALAIVPGSMPVLWGFSFLALLVISFWARYQFVLRELRG
ncbi:hypothetical protein ACQBAT_04830 [Ornithinimicrobium sp. Y1847]|uniref:hypothetical protein n=1 Tax=Ornithinimicrobium sp. Y1847 TaxID=3405419 RepID=UPI003B6746EB